MRDFLIQLSHQRRYWLLLLLFGFGLEAAALYFPYALDEWPCVLCIHVRIAVLAFMIIAIFALFCTQSSVAMRVLHGVNTVTMLWFLERSYQVLAVERGWTFGDCAMDLGTPDWFAIDKWLPSVFEVQTSCGYTPMLWFNITMAEALVAISAILIIISATLFVSSWKM